MVASALPDGQRQACVQQMLDIVVQPLQSILQTAPAEPAGSGPPTPTAGGGPPSPRPARRPGQLALVLPLMERVTTILRAAQDPADVAEALVRLWPWIETALGGPGRGAQRHVGLLWVVVRQTIISLTTTCSLLSA
jgi:hypothetical protein